MFRSLDPKKRRLYIIVLLAAALFVAAVVVPVVVVANYFQNAGKTEEPISVLSGEPTQTPQVSPTPTSIKQAMPSQIQEIATPSRLNCTHTAGYWLNHQELWPTLISVNEFNYTKEEAILRLQSGIHLIPGNLFLELHTALLNVLFGAEAGSASKIMDQAIQWLSAHPERRPLTELELQQALTLAGFLKDFNNGISGPGLCEGESPSDALPDIGTLFPTQTSIIEISTITLTITPGQFTKTPTLSSTLKTATSTQTASAVPPIPIPSATRTNRPPRPRNTQAPSPTPVPTQVPTATPRPTNTPIPPPPPTPTSPPPFWFIIQ